MYVISLINRKFYDDDIETKVQHHIYSAFGELVNTVDASNNVISGNEVLAPFFSYTNREFDRESGLYHYRARTYDASIGRFIQVDPDPGRMTYNLSYTNKYIYGFNNPLKYKDASGRSPFAFITATLKSVVAPYVLPAIAAISSGLTANSNGGNLFQSLGVALVSYYATFGAQAVTGALNFYLTPWGADFVTPITTGLISFSQNAANQAIMSKGENVNWKRAWKAGYHAAAIQATSNALSFWSNGTPLGLAIDITAGAAGVACTDDGVTPRSNAEVEASRIEFSCNFTFGANSNDAEMFQ